MIVTARRLAHTAVVVLALAVGLASPVAAGGAQPPPNKQTALGKYLTSAEAHPLVTRERDKTLFVDVRTAAELTYVGVPEGIDAAVPFAELTPTWDDKAGRFTVLANAAFVDGIDAALARKGLTRSDRVIVICRSGERSAKAVNMLAAKGYTNAYSVTDGFEGDVSKEGRRDINGWRKSGLPWKSTIERKQVSPVPPVLR
jgi:rhodanese-related sulfurtransferase